jgi:hypothetical protein
MQRFCVNCKHYNWNPIRQHEPHECHRKISLVTGETSSLSCEAERKPVKEGEQSTRCTDTGDYWAAKT